MRAHMDAIMQRDHPQRLGQLGGQAADVGDLAATDDQMHGGHGEPWLG